MHAQHMIVMQRRTGAPHSVTRPRGAERGPDPWVEVDREGARARYRCLQRVASRQSGVTSSPLLASKLDVNSRPEGSFSSSVFLYSWHAQSRNASAKKKKSPRGGGACATRATCELRACYVYCKTGTRNHLSCNREYASRSRRLTLRVKNGWFDMSAPAEYAIFEQHALDFDNVEMIDCERHGLRQRVKEALHINAEKHCMNKDKGLEWNPFWFSLFPLCSVSKGITYLVSQLPTRYLLLL